MEREKENNAADEKKLSASRNARKLKNGENKGKTVNGGMDSLDKALARQEQESLKANRIAATDPELQGKTRLQARAGEITMALVAALIGSFATVCIMLPNGLTFGGITGIAKIVQNYTGWNYSLIYYAFSMIIACSGCIYRCGHGRFQRTDIQGRLLIGRN